MCIWSQSVNLTELPDPLTSWLLTKSDQFCNKLDFWVDTSLLAVWPLSLYEQLYSCWGSVTQSVHKTCLFVFTWAHECMLSSLVQSTVSGERFFFCFFSFWNPVRCSKSRPGPLTVLGVLFIYLDFIKWTQKWQFLHHSIKSQTVPLCTWNKQRDMWGPFDQSIHKQTHMQKPCNWVCADQTVSNHNGQIISSCSLKGSSHSSTIN